MLDLFGLHDEASRRWDGEMDTGARAPAVQGSQASS
jgi:hypothetical protein